MKKIVKKGAFLLSLSLLTSQAVFASEKHEESKSAAAPYGFHIPSTMKGWHEVAAATPYVGSYADSALTLLEKGWKTEFVQDWVEWGVDSYAFFRSWLAAPLRMGAACPLSKSAARLMAQDIQRKPEMSILEIGPGTGIVTRQILAKGVPQNELLCVELGAEFIGPLREKFPDCQIRQGDAANLGTSLFPEHKGRISTIVSTLPIRLFGTQSLKKIIDASLSMLCEDGVFIQVTTYLPTSPFNHRDYGLEGKLIGWALSPYPSFVWVYQRDKKEK